MTDIRCETESCESPSSRMLDKPVGGERAKQFGGSETLHSLKVYSLQELTAMKESRLSQEWPKYLDEAFKNHRGFWDPEKWFQSFLGNPEDKTKSNSERPVSGFPNPREATKKRDPKERVKSDQNDIVLSPQRGSFTTGCQVPSVNGMVSSNGETKKDEISLRPDASRRVGSGRILARDRDIDEIERDNNGRRFDRRDDRYDSRSFRRDFGGGQDDRGPRRVDPEVMDPRTRRDPVENTRRDREDTRTGRNVAGEGWYTRREDREEFSHGSRRGGNGEHRGGAYGDDRNYRRRHGDSNHWKHENDEPEWMSATVDQNELMELRGFEDSPEKEDQDPLQKFKMEMKEKELKLRRIKQEELDEAAKRMPPKQEPDILSKAGQEFDIDDILKIAVIPGFTSMLNDEMNDLDNGQPEATGSRFSQFFRPSNQHVSESSKVAAPSVRIPSPGDPSAYFAPISPAAKTNSEPQSSNSILSMLMMNSQVDSTSDNQGPTGGSALTLSELRDKTAHSVGNVEADIKQMAGIQDVHQRLPFGYNLHSQQVPQNEMTAFEKFAALVGGKTEPQPQVLQKTNLVQSIDVGRRSLIKPSPIPANAPTEQEILAGMIGPKHAASSVSGNLRQLHQLGLHQLSMPDLLSVIHNAPFNPEVLKRPEAHALQAALSANHVKLEVLVEHLATGNMPQLQREVLLNVLKFAQIQGQLGPVPSHTARVQNPRHVVPPQNIQDNHAFLHLHQQFGLSNTTRLPSHNQPPPPTLDLNAHSNHFLQNVLMKKKREEDNIRNRQEISQVENCISSSKVRSTDSPLTFTPTAVMKKIVAERRDSDPAMVKNAGSETKVAKNSGKETPDCGLHSFIRSSPYTHPETASLMHQSQLGSDFFHMQNQIHAFQQQQLRLQSKLAFPRAAFANVADHQRGHPLQQPRFYHPVGPSHQIRADQQSPIIPSQLSSQVQHPAGGLLQFLPEVLAQAGSVGQLPPLPTQKVLTLEELERQSSAVTIQ